MSELCRQMKIKLKSTYSESAQKLARTVAQAKAEGKEVIVMGDLNGKHTKFGAHRTSGRGRKLAKELNDQELFSMNPREVETHKSGAVIDLVLSTDPKVITEVDIGEYVNVQERKPDHRPVHVEVRVKHQSILHKPVTRMDYKNTDWDEYEETVRKWDWTSVTRPEVDFQEAADNFHVAMRKIQKLVIPVKKWCPKSKIWWTKDLNNIRREINQLKTKIRKLKRTKNVEQIKMMKKLLNHAKRQYRKAIGRSKSEYYNGRWKDLKNEENSAVAWKRLKRLRNDESKQFPNLKIGGKVILEPAEKANAMNQAFVDFGVVARSKDHAEHLADIKRQLDKIIMKYLLRPIRNE